MKKYLNSNFDHTQLIDLLDELPFWSAPFGLKLLDYVEYKINMSALDIGFCLGFPLTEIAMRLGESCTVYGIDPWKEGIERAQKKLDCYSINNVNIIEGVAESIPLADKSIDLITSNNGLNNVADIDQSISECSRIIKSGGQFVQTMNMDKSMFEFYHIFESVLSEYKMYNEIEAMHKHIAEKRPSIDYVTSLLRKHEFIIKDIEQDQFNYKFADGTAMLNHYFIRFAFMDSWIKILPKDRIEEIFDKIEKELNLQASRLGGLKLSIPYFMINAIRQ